MANTAAKKITYDNKPVQVESAIRDGTGKVINTTYLPLTGRVFYATPNESTATATLTATISNFPSAYADGIMIALRMPFANSASTTLNVNGLGAKPVYYANTTTSASRLAANAVVMLVYETTTVSTGCWKAVYSYDSNNTTSCRQQLQTGNDNRPLLMSYGKIDNATSNVDNITYRNNGIYANPSTGKITAVSGSVASNDAQLVTGGAVYTALQSYLPLSGGTLTGSLTLTGTNGITSNNIVFNDWKLGVARNASGKLYRYVGLDTNSTTGWLKTRAEADVITDLGIDLKAPLDSPALTGTPTAPTATAGTNTTQIATTAFVKTAIDAMPEPMIFKGTLGTGGTITSLPTAAASNEGYVYKVITDGTYASQSAKVGDTFISTGSAWVLIPSGDEPSGTVTNVATGVGLTGGPVTSSGTIKAKLKSETNATYDSNTVTNTSGRQYAVVPDKTNGYLSVNVPWTDSNVKANICPSAQESLITYIPVIPNGNETSDTSLYVRYGVYVQGNPLTGDVVTAPHFYSSVTGSLLDFIVGNITSLTEVN